MEDKLGGACSTQGRDEKCLQNVDGKTEEKRLVGRPRRRWVDNIRMDFREIGGRCGLDSPSLG
jgi:hypothetical protein